MDSTHDAPCERLSVKAWEVSWMTSERKEMAAECPDGTHVWILRSAMQIARILTRVLQLTHRRNLSPWSPDAGPIGHNPSHNTAYTENALRHFRFRALFAPFISCLSYLIEID